MKPAPPLSQVVAYQNQLANLRLDSTVAQWKHDLAQIMHVTTCDPNVRFKKNNARAQQASEALEASMEGLQRTVQQLQQSVADLIATQQQQYLDRSQSLWDQEMRHESNNYILSRTLNIHEQDRERILARVLTYCDWRMPGLVVRPAREQWVDHLVALDPLYLVDQNLDLLQPALDRFPENYQRRLRPYAVDDRSERDIFWQLPRGQFGYIFAYNFLNFRPMRQIQRYLKEWFDLCRPGGVVFFTFNDCDWAHNVALAEQNFMCYTPGHEISRAAQALGFQTLDHYHGQADCAWVELRRPGDLVSQRAAQTLAKIIPGPK